jgi:hypothetical protein
MPKQQLLDDIEKTWTAFQASYEGLTPGQMQQPGVAGEWSVRDIFAHVTTWEEESLKHLPLIAAGERPGRYKELYGGIDAFNAQMTAAKRELPLDEVLRQLEATHGRLVEYIAAAPYSQFASGTRCRRRLGWDSYKHYPQHEQAIREWRGRLGI